MPRTVLITGVSSGIGRVTVDLMARRGWQVAGTSRDPAAIQGWAREDGIAVFPLDVTQEAAVAGVVAAVVERFGASDVLVNNAGYGVFGPLEGATPEQVELQFRTNVLGAIALIRHVLPIMRGRRSGTIIDVTSIAGRVASPFASLYHASKYAIEGLSESLRFEASLHGVRVKLIEPAHFKTDFFGRSLRLTRQEAYETNLSNFMEQVRVEDRRAPGPGPVAEAILMAAEDTSPRLRYPVRGRFILVLTSLLPDAIWRSLVGGGHDSASEDQGSRGRCEELTRPSGRP